MNIKAKIINRKLEAEATTTAGETYYYYEIRKNDAPLADRVAEAEASFRRREQSEGVTFA